MDSKGTSGVLERKRVKSLSLISYPGSVRNGLVCMTARR